VTTPADLLTRELRRDGSRPFITWYGGAAGERVELSIATTANWVAKIAGYVEDELDVYSSDPIVIDPTLHWVTAVALLAIWQTGASVSTQGEGDGERLELPLDPMGMGLSRMVAAYPDSYSPVAPSGSDPLASAIGAVADGARVLTSLPLTDSGLAVGLLGPLAAGGSVVYSPADTVGLAERALAERVTHTAGLDVPGLPRLG
jgi:uncharacterized protein (TIGR03089 family)